MGVRTGDPRQFETFQALQAAYLKQLAYFALHCEIANNNSEITLAQRYPTVYTSALIEDCIENGRKARPQDYQDLTVRVAGYVAYFTRLGKAVQDSIIARTEHNA